MSDYTVIESIMKAVCVVICAVITRYVAPMIKANIDSKKLENIMYYASILVAGAEQKIRESGAGERKLAEVTELLSAKAKQIGLSLTADEIRLIIEDAVKTMKENM